MVILFLITVALLGLGANLLSKHYSQIRIIDYINQDFGKININQANKEELICLIGIGEKLAQRIIEYRQDNGRFFDIVELKNIKGIGDYKYRKIKDYFTVE